MVLTTTFTFAAHIIISNVPRNIGAALKMRSGIEDGSSEEYGILVLRIPCVYLALRVEKRRQDCAAVLPMDWSIIKF